MSNYTAANISDNVININITCNPTSYTIGGTITGLTANGLILQNNGTDNLTTAANDSTFQFSTSVASAGSYNVTVFAQPTGLTCTVGNYSGANVSSNVSNITVVCSPTSYTIGGTISGLTANNLVLKNNSGNNLSIGSGSTTFQFTAPVAAGGSYNVTLSRQPLGLTCSVTNSSGSNVLANITSVSVTCRPLFLYVSTNSPADRVGQFFANTGGGIPNFNIAGLHNPTGIAIDNQNNLFVANNSTNVIGKYNATTGAVINASFISGVVGMNGIAVDTNNNLFVTQNGGANIRKYNSSTGTLINAGFISGIPTPNGIVVDNSGNLYVVINSDHVGKFSTTTGLGNPNFIPVVFSGNVTGISLDANGYLYLSGIATGFVSKYNSFTGASVAAPLIGGLSCPNSSGVDANGYIYIVDCSNGFVVKFTTAGGPVSTPFVIGVGVPYYVALY